MEEEREEETKIKKESTLLVHQSQISANIVWSHFSAQFRPAEAM